MIASGINIKETQPLTISGFARYLTQGMIVVSSTQKVCLKMENMYHTQEGSFRKIPLYIYGIIVHFPP